MRRCATASILVLLVVIAAAPAFAGLNAEEGADAVRTHIETQTAKHGKFWVYDEVTDESLALKLVSMHDTHWGLIDDETYFASGEFIDAKGDKYMVDVVLRGASADALEVVSVEVQERGGEARYSWAEADGRWTKQP
ncbi:MAG: hypothetical protein AAGC60_17170 [Acidobacteriota bacterium]